MDLSGMVAVVTGASRGIGRSIALTLARQGAEVVLSARSAEALDPVAGEIREIGGRPRLAPMDVGNREDVARTLRGVIEETSGVHILVNNAGVRHDRLLVRIKPEDWQATLDVNLSGPLFCMQQVISAMSRQRFGRIVNIASVVALCGNVGQSSYGAAKAGILGLTRSAAREYAARGVTVNAVAPGFIQTDMADEVAEGIREALVGQIPMGRLGTPAEVAHTVAFLVSREAGYITGQVIQVNGGLYV